MPDKVNEEQREESKVKDDVDKNETTSFELQNAREEAEKKVRFVKELAREKRRKEFKKFLAEAFINRQGVYVWAFSSVFWLCIVFTVFSIYTKKYTMQIVAKCYREQIEMESVKPILDAQEEADKIISEARKKAKLIIKAANTEVGKTSDN